ncbi:collagen binding domain-containing protein [Streptomyces sp. NPDC059631]|uniref:MSCRAMM family protein n=1 Tax=unclassified Streptomyces TaxID=2593676 RepID=UPI00367DA84D
MHARLIRSAASVAVAMAGALTWAPAASAQPSEPSPPASAAHAEAPATDAGSVEITTKDTAGDFLPGAVFLLLDADGREAGRGQSDAQGKLVFPELAPGVYRLKQTASGDPLHEVVADRDLIVTPGAATRIAITDQFKAAKILLQVKDDKTGKLLPGATVNIGTGTSTLLTLTTGPQGRASAEAPVSSRSTRFWFKEITAPTGYDLHKPSITATATPGSSVTVTITNTATQTEPKPGASDRPTHQPAHTSPASGTLDSPDHEAEPSATVTGTPDADPSPTAAVPPTGDTASKTPAGSLARTGADHTLWIAAGAGILLAAGAGSVVAARRRTADGLGRE